MDMHSCVHDPGGKNDEGATTVEYSLIASWIAVVVLSERAPLGTHASQ
jgi:Flp pilus assembly pilin Flp